MDVKLHVLPPDAGGGSTQTTPIGDGTKTREVHADVERTAQEARLDYNYRAPEQIAYFFDGLELLEPGVVPMPQWRPDPGMSPASPALCVRHRHRCAAERPWSGSSWGWLLQSLSSTGCWPPGAKGRLSGGEVWTALRRFRRAAGPRVRRTPCWAGFACQ
jgi:hypothetical protein